MNTVRCLVVEDEPYSLRGLVDAINAMSDLEVVGEAGSLPEALGLDVGFDIVLLDLSLPGTCRRTAITTLLEAWPKVPVLVTTSFATGPDVVQAFGEGASGYVKKHADTKELHKAIKAVAAGRSYITPALEGYVRNSPGIVITERQRTILRLIAQGHTNAEVAAKLSLAERTVEGHIAEIRNRCSLQNRPRSELTRFAIESDPGCDLDEEQHELLRRTLAQVRRRLAPKHRRP
jgi:DNA-binding NarL/FixJ family response regulator